MPSAQALLPYLHRIDAAHTYTNGGPLCRELQEALSLQFYGAGECRAVCVANGTLALEAAIRAVAKPTNHGVCLLPAWTFCATAHAVRNAGLLPVPLDVSRDDWMLSPEAVRRHLRTSDVRPACVVTVSAFGAPVAISEWEGFQYETRIPVVIDAAAAIDTIRGSSCASVLSLHATKPVGAGEGGVVMASDPNVLRAVSRSTSFGFDGARVATQAGTNAKLSEYHAAVALASLDQWCQVRDALMVRAREYRRLLGDNHCVQFQTGWGQTWISSTLNVQTPVSVEAIAPRLLAEGIEARSWWGPPLDQHPAFEELDCTHATHAKWLSRHVVGLPFHTGLDAAQIERVANALENVTSTVPMVTT